MTHLKSISQNLDAKVEAQPPKPRLTPQEKMARTVAAQKAARTRGEYEVFLEMPQWKFWEQINKKGDDECWEWTGYRRVEGYGEMRFHHFLFRTHRIAYMTASGQIENGLSVCHKCDNPPCCNPNHLFLGTRSENSKDMLAKGRNHRGEKASSVVTEEIVRLIRVDAEMGVPWKQIASKFKLKYTTAWAIITRARWGHVG
jgi:hypothetical protein